MNLKRATFVLVVSARHRRARAAARASDRSRGWRRRAGSGPAPAQQHSGVHAGDRPSRRREQRAARVPESRAGRAHDSGDRDTRRRRTERDRVRAERPAGSAANRRARSDASLRRDRAVFHPRDRLRLLVQRRRDDGEMGTGRNHQRLRPVDPHDAPRCRDRDESHRHRRRPASSGVGTAQSRSIQGRGRCNALSGTDPRWAHAVAAPQVLLPGRRPRRRPWATRRAGGRTAAAWRAEGGGLRRVGVRPAARPDVRRDRHRRARDAQEPGDGGAARVAVGPRSAALSAGGLVRAARSHAGGRAVAVRRHRHDHSRTRVARERHASTRARVRAPHDCRPRVGRAETVRCRRSVRRRAVAPRGSQRGADASPAARDDGARRRSAVQHRCAIEDERRSVHRGRASGARTARRGPVGRRCRCAGAGRAGVDDDGRSRTAGHGLVRCARWLCDAREVSIWADGGWRGVSLRRHHANSRERQNHQTLLEADPEDRALRVRA